MTHYTKSDITTALENNITGQEFRGVVISTLHQLQPVDPADIELAIQEGYLPPWKEEQLMDLIENALVRAKPHSEAAQSYRSILQWNAGRDTDGYGF